MLLTESIRNRLTTVDTPTICNAIEVAQGSRGFSDFTRSTVLASDPEAPPIVGYALTARIAAVKSPVEKPEIIRKRRMDYYRYMAEGAVDRPSVVVIEDTDYPDCIGAFWGEINTRVHQGFGHQGVLTNGVMRDLDDMADNFPVLAGSIGPSHGFVHVLDFDQPVEVFNMKVKPGQLIHADKHGALIIPDDLLDALEDAITTLLCNERIILDAVKQPGFGFAAFEQAWKAFENART